VEKRRVTVPRTSLKIWSILLLTCGRLLWAQSALLVRGSPDGLRLCGSDPRISE
jgi:hypothetical protein